MSRAETEPGESGGPAAPRRAIQPLNRPDNLNLKTDKFTVKFNLNLNGSCHLDRDRALSHPIRIGVLPPGPDITAPSDGRARVITVIMMPGMQ
jgi:hypothetical protein